MKQLLPILILLGASLAACRSTPPPAVERLGPHTASVDVDLDQAFEIVPRVGIRIGYAWNEARPDEAQVVLRSAPEQGFFSLLGEQVRFQEATVRLREDSGRLEVRVDAELVHGPPGGPFQRNPRIGLDWYDDFFYSLSVELDRLNLEVPNATSGE